MKFLSRFPRAVAIAVVAMSCIVSDGATTLGELQITNEVYTASQTDERIKELAGSSDKITDGTNTIDAAGNVLTTNVIPPWNDGERYWYWDASNDNWTNGTSYLHLSGNYLVVSGFPYGEGDPADIAQGILDPNDLSVDLYYLEGMGEGFFGTFTRQYVPGKTSRLALTNDIPQSVTVVAPTTNAVSGTAADAKATGTALYTGFTPWEYSGLPEGPTPGSKAVVLQEPTFVSDPESGEYYFRMKIETNNDICFFATQRWPDRSHEDDLSLTLEDEDYIYLDITATRNLVTPKKTSQLTNDGTNGVPFAVLSDSQVKAIDSVVDDRQTVVVYRYHITNRIDIVGELSSGAITNLENAMSIHVGSAVTSIGDSALTESERLIDLTLGRGITNIGNFAFGDCWELKSVTIPDSVISIGDSAFYSCSRLNSITIPDSVTSIGDSAFYKCIRLTSMTIPDSVTSIMDNAFSGCIGLKSMTIGNGVTIIGTNAFAEGVLATNITFRGKTLSEVSAMQNYPWGITDTSIIKTENEATQEWVGDNFLSATGGVVIGAVSLYGGFAQGCAGVTATGKCAHAEGTNTTASGSFSHAEGASTTASGSYSHAEGNLTKATAPYSHAQGYNTEANGTASSAFGISCIARGRSGLAAGANANASNDFSFVWSSKDYNNKATFYGSHGPGTFNINPTNCLAGIWIGETNLQNHIRAEMSSKADVSDLPYAMVTSGEWEFSGLGYDASEAYRVRFSEVSDSTYAFIEAYDPVNDYWEMVAAPLTDVSGTELSLSWDGGYITATRASLPGHLCDRANNQVKSSDTLQMTLPPPIPNKSRDFRVRLVITEPITSPDKITFVGATTNGVQESISFEAESGTFPTLNAISTNILHFTETAPSIFDISCKTVGPVSP